MERFWLTWRFPQFMCFTVCGEQVKVVGPIGSGFVDRSVMSRNEARTLWRRYLSRGWRPADPAIVPPWVARKARRLAVGDTTVFNLETPARPVC